nr:MAG TPA: hypothetical protein [Bacteriophage sp.]
MSHKKATKRSVLWLFSLFSELFRLIILPWFLVSVTCL